VPAIGVESKEADGQARSPSPSHERQEKLMNKDRPLAKGEKKDMNRDPLSGAPGSHPVGTGIGAVAGGLAAGAAAGSVAGPAGTVVGAAVGAVAGGLAGKGVAELIDPTAEDAYWQDNYSSRPYFTDDYSYDDYGPAYRYGVDSYSLYNNRTWDAAEADMASGWERAKGKSRLSWESAKHAARDAWNRVSDTVERAIPGDSDRDGK
jgi:hypothetical protein